MRMYDILEKKKRGQALSEEEIRFFIQGYVAGEIPDYQASAFSMAVYFQGMNDEEMGNLTLAMRDSGDRIDLSAVQGYKVDKHSTGGVGDKTTLVVAPVVAACGGIVAKLSGRGLGHTGGTLDKLEAIPGFSTSLSKDKFVEQINRIHIAVAGQTGNLVPADKKLYALRDVTATVDSLPLIASSIMSKKLASGSDGIVLDVKTGSGAFMKKLPDSIALAEKMVAIGEHAGKKVSALVTDMDQPLGHAVGNLLEVKEALEVLQGEGPDDLRELCIALSGKMLEISGLGSYEECKEKAKSALVDGTGYIKFKEMVKAQGGDMDELMASMDNLPLRCVLRASCEGYLASFHTEGVGLAAACLGAGREKKEDSIDYFAGILLKKKCGDYVFPEDVVAELYAKDASDSSVEEAKLRLQASIVYSTNAPTPRPMIFQEIDGK